MISNLVSAPLSPITSNDDEQDWINELLAKSAPITTTNSFTGLSTLNPVSNNFDLTNLQQSDLNQFFDTESIFSGNDAASSSETSEVNSPHIKVENSDNILADLCTVNSKLQDLKQLNDFTPKSLESIFDTKDILKDDLKISSSPNLFTDKYSSASSLSNLNSSIKKPINKSAPKRRNPRKRLTDSQKQAHNKIEKKYRININAKIAGLQQIIPWVAFEKTAFETGADSDFNANENPCNKLNKSMILEKAMDYILYLQERDQKITQENMELKKEILRLGGNI